jgi:Zn-dependent protease
VTVPASSALTALACPGCGAQIPRSFLACPTCARLLHAHELRTLASEGETAERAGDYPRALAAWRKALELLPRGTAQHGTVSALVEGLSARVPLGARTEQARAPEQVASKGRNAKGAGAAGLGAIGIALAKFKWVILLLLGKAKVLLLGLTQAKTLLSMVFAAGVYTMAFGWWFAVGLVLTTYVHEMGHVVWLRRYGIAASAPMFVPGFGAFVRLHQYPATPAEDARVGLAGPVWGATAAVCCLILGHLTGSTVVHAIAHVSAWINLFNLLPVWQLDGARGFTALSQRQRIVVAAVAWLLALCGIDGFLFVLAAVITFRAARPAGAPKTGDAPVLAVYVSLMVGLTLLLTLGPKLPH